MPKQCQYKGCHFPVAKSARFCPKHCAAILRELWASPEYRTEDREGKPPAMTATPPYMQQATKGNASDGGSL